MEYKSAFTLRVFFHHQCVCVLRASMSVFGSSVSVQERPGEGSAKDCDGLDWPELGSNYSEFKIVPKQEWGGEKKTHMHPLYSGRKRRQEPYLPHTALEGRLCLVAHPNNISAHSLPLWASTELSLVQGLKWSACQSPGTWLGHLLSQIRQQTEASGKCLCCLGASIHNHSTNEWSGQITVQIKLLDRYIVLLDFSLLIYLLGDWNRTLLLRDFLARDFAQGQCALSVAFKIYFIKRTLLKKKRSNTVRNFLVCVLGFLRRVNVFLYW